MDDKLILLNKLARAAGVKPGTAREAARRGRLKAVRVETEVGASVGGRVELRCDPVLGRLFARALGTWGARRLVNLR